MKLRSLILLAATTPLIIHATACAGDDDVIPLSGDGDGDGDASGGGAGDGDGDSTGGMSGDGDGDSTGGMPGDGDGDSTGGVPGDGDGDATGGMGGEGGTGGEPATGGASMGGMGGMGGGPDPSGGDTGTGGDEGTGGTAASTRCVTFCDDFATTCGFAAAAAYYSDEADCLGYCEGAAEASLGCRETHLGFAANGNPVVHCEHASESGGNVCQ